MRACVRAAAWPGRDATARIGAGPRFRNAPARVDASHTLTRYAPRPFFPQKITVVNAMLKPGTTTGATVGIKERERRRKRGGHTLSKMRFISAQLEAYLDDDVQRG